MVHLKDNIKIGYRIEKVYDVTETAPFPVENYLIDGCYIVRTDLGDIMLTCDTQIMRSDGCYIRVDQIKPYSQSLKHVSGVAVVTDLIAVHNREWMVKIWETDYIIVNGFYIAPDM